VRSNLGAKAVIIHEIRLLRKYEILEISQQPPPPLVRIWRPEMPISPKLGSSGHISTPTPLAPGRTQPPATFTKRSPIFKPRNLLAQILLPRSIWSWDTKQSLNQGLRACSQIAISITFNQGRGLNIYARLVNCSLRQIAMRSLS
jgi:hypothetical protein